MFSRWKNGMEKEGIENYDRRRFTSFFSHVSYWGWTCDGIPSLLSVKGQMSSSTQSFRVFHYKTLLQVFLSLPGGRHPTTSTSFAILTQLSSSLVFTSPDHLNLICLSKKLHEVNHSTSFFFLFETPSSYLTLAMYLNILRSVPCRTFIILSVRAHVSSSHTRSNTSHIYF